MAQVAEVKAKAALLERKQKLENEPGKLRLQEQLAIAQAREQAFTQLDMESKCEILRMSEYLGKSLKVHKENPTLQLTNTEPAII